MSQVAVLLLAALGGYLLGSLSPAYYAGRRLGGIDLRRAGSGNLGGTNVWVQFGPRAFAAVGLLDVLKGAWPTAIALGLAGPEAAAAAGLGAIAGHNWSLYLSFTGGRGAGSALGVLAVLAPRPLLGVLLVVALGYALRQPAPFMAAAVLLAAPLAAWLGEGPAVIVACAGVALLMLAKRLHANGLAPPQGARRRSVLFWRLCFDRDIADDAAWQRSKR